MEMLSEARIVPASSGDEEDVGEERSHRLIFIGGNDCALSSLCICGFAVIFVLAAAHS